MVGRGGGAVGGGPAGTGVAVGAAAAAVPGARGWGVAGGYAAGASAPAGAGSTVASGAPPDAAGGGWVRGSPVVTIVTGRSYSYVTRLEAHPATTSPAPAATHHARLMPRPPSTRW